MVSKDGGIPKFMGFSFNAKKIQFQIGDGLVLYPPFEEPPDGLHISDDISTMFPFKNWLVLR